LVKVSSWSSAQEAAENSSSAESIAGRICI
jgi:hypothetical protein